MLPNNTNDTTIRKYITQQNRDSLTKDSPIALLSALYQRQDFVFVDSTHNPSLTESNITKTFGYKSSFYLSFISDKDSLNNEYLQARKSLYKTYQLIKQEQTQAIEQERLELQRSKEELEQQLQGLDSKQRESKLQELQREHIREQREKERQEQRQARFSKNLANTYNTSTTQNLNTNNNAYITKDSYLVLESNDRNTLRKTS